MTTIEIPGHVRIDDLDVWVDQRGEGPDVLLLGGLTDPVESWDFQLQGLSDRYRLTAFDNPGAGRTALPEGDLTTAGMADIAAGVLAELGVESAHVMGFSGGSLIGQEVALRHPELVRSLTLVSTWSRVDAYGRAMTEMWRVLPEAFASEKEMMEAFFIFVYTARAHENGMVEAIIKDALEFPHPQSAEAFIAQLDAFVAHDAHDRLAGIAAPTLVTAGSEDIGAPPRLGRIVADLIPNSRFLVLEGEAHQPFQEVPEDFNALVDGFWKEVEAA